MSSDIPTADLSRAIVRWDPIEVGITNAIRRELGLGRILAGQRLPEVPALAARFGVDPSTIERVLHNLQHGAMLSPGPSGELLLRDPPSNRSLLPDRLQRDPLGTVHFTEYRAVIEGGAAGIAALRRTEDDIRAMEEAQQRLVDSPDQISARNADQAFHLAIAYATDNAPLIEAIEDARMEVVGAVDLMQRGFIKVASYHGHEVILRAIRAGNVHEAGEAMRLHIDTTRQEFLKQLDDDDIEHTLTGPY